MRNTYVGRVEDKTYVSGNINTQSGGRIEVLLESNVRKRFILDDSLLEWKLGSARDYQKITKGEKYCFETYGFERATDENLIPYLYGLHIVEVKPVAECK